MVTDNHLTFECCYKRQPNNENYSNSKLRQTGEFRDVTGTGDDYS